MLKFNCRKVLPTVFDESLSYYEAICKLAKIVEEVVDNVEDLDSRVTALEQEINGNNANYANLDSAIGGLNNRVMALEEKGETK